MNKGALIFTCILIASAGLSYADGLGSLIEIARGQADIAQTYKSETRAFEGVKRAVESGSIIKGQSKKTVSQYGSPVVVIEKFEGKWEKWVYKPATSTFFKGPKITILFDENGMVDQIITTQ